MSDLLQDLRYSLRALRRDRGFTSLAVVTLAVGIAANATVFGAVYSVLLRPFPYAESDRIAFLWTDVKERGLREQRSSLGNVGDWRAQSRSFEDLAVFDQVSVTVAGSGWPEQLAGARVSANLFSVLGAQPALGRAFSAAEERSRERVVVISHGLWERRFASSPDAVGAVLEIDGRPSTVVGVMPERFAFPSDDVQLWEPSTLFSDWEEISRRRGVDSWRVVGRLGPGVSLEQAAREMDVIAAGLEQSYPEENRGLGIAVVPLYDQMTGATLRQSLWALFGAVGLVLLIAATNVAYLFLTRGLARERELAVRAALGATRLHLVRQAVVESLLVALAGGALGLALAVWGTESLSALAEGRIPRLGESEPVWRIAGFTAALSIAVAVLCSIAPALFASLQDPVRSLKAGRTASAGPGAHRARSALVAFQFALAVILVYGAGLLVRSYYNVNAVDPGFRAEGVLVAQVSLPRERSDVERLHIYDRVLERVGSLPGVERVAAIEDMFISSPTNRRVAVDGAPGAPAEGHFEQLRVDTIAGEYFRALDVPLLEGRHFSAADTGDGVGVAVVNETMAKRLWPRESAVGRRFRFVGEEADGEWLTVVGVVGDMRRQELERYPIAQVFRPQAQRPSRNLYLLVRAPGGGSGLADAIRAEVHAVDRAVPVYNMSTLERQLESSLAARRLPAVLLTLFSIVALALAAVGIYGLVAHTVAARTREIGIRVALGARARDVVALVLTRGLSPVALAAALGAAAAVSVSRLLASQLYGVAAQDLSTLGGTVLALVAVALLAGFLPARRAAKVDPLVALRRE